MTDGTQIASDSQVSKGDVRFGETTKVVIDGDVAFCFAGTVCLFAPLIAWYKAGCKPEDAPKNTANWSHTLWVLDPRKGPQEFQSVERCPYPSPLSFPAAMGSGGDFALGALLAGASLEDAVGIAISQDVYSGGEIKVIDIPKPRPEPTVTPKRKQGWLRNALRRYLIEN